MKLRERMESLQGNPMICLGAHSSFLYIAPKDEMFLWLQEDQMTKKVFNEMLMHDQKNGKRLKERVKEPFLDREITSEEWNDIPHHALIVLIEGHEYGRYATRGEVIKQDLTKDFKVTSEHGCEWLIDEILADFAHDITNFLVFEEVYHHGELSFGGQKKHDKLRRQYVHALDFLESENVSMWTDIGGTWIIKQAEKDVDNRIHDIKRRVLKLIAWDARLNSIYSVTQRDKIADLIVDGVTPAAILKVVGRGKGELATVDMMKDVTRRFEQAMKRETKKYLSHEACLHMDVPLKQQMKVNNAQLAKAWKERLENAMNHGKESDE